MSNNKNWPELLEHVKSTFEIKLSELNLDPALADEFVLALASSIGGLQVYFPSGRDLKAHRRAEAIFKEYAEGATARELGRKYQLTESSVRSLIGKIKNQ